MRLKLKRPSSGQALVEFALIITVLLMIIFLIIEVARVLWAWNQVQNAAREGARYAITGQIMPGDCAVANLPKFTDTITDTAEGYGVYNLCVEDTDEEYSSLLRVASIVSVTHQALTGLPLNETSGRQEDDNYYLIKIWGVDSDRVIQEDFAGAPLEPVWVRVTYQVPIITPFFRPFAKTIPVFGQVLLNNENFGQLGGSSQGNAKKPQSWDLPDPAVTPSPTATLPPDVTPPTETPLPTSTPPARCAVRFEGFAYEGDTFVSVTGEEGTTVNLYYGNNASPLLGTNVLTAQSGHECSGFADFSTGGVGELAPLIRLRPLLAEGDDGTSDVTFVRPKPSATMTPTLTFTPDPLPTEVPNDTPTPAVISLSVNPSCGSPGVHNAYTVSFNVVGTNFPANTAVSLFLVDPEGGETPFTSTPVITTTSGGAFHTSETRANLAEGTHRVRARYNGNVLEASYQVPCSDYTPPPPTPDVDPTPAPADLIVVGAPQLASSRPITAYQPVSFAVTVKNIGGAPVNSLFFVDLFFNPVPPVISGTVNIPIEQSAGYLSLNSLAAGASETITVTSYSGFANEPASNLVYAMVDSLQGIDEYVETNNISEAVVIDDVRTAPTPTPTPTPSGERLIHGLVYRPTGGKVTKVLRANLILTDLGTGAVRTVESSSENGYFVFDGVANGTYSLLACSSVNGVTAGKLSSPLTILNNSIVVIPLLNEADGSLCP